MKSSFRSKKPFAIFVAALGRGPGRSRPLTRDEASEAMGLILEGKIHPAQLGAFLMLLRYRGEDPAEITGLVEAARAEARLPTTPVDLDWPSYGAGRTRDAPWFLLAALALSQSGLKILMHGSNEFGGGLPVSEALTTLGMTPASTPDEARANLTKAGFAYLKLSTLSPTLDALLQMRALLGLRSPINTVARLLDPADAKAGVDGVFHPPYIETHLAVATLLDRPSLLVLKGGGGEAERNPSKPCAAQLCQHGKRRALLLPTLTEATPPTNSPSLAALWHGTVRDDALEARIIGTIALGLLALNQGSDAEAAEIWRARRKNL